MKIQYLYLVAYEVNKKLLKSLVRIFVFLFRSYELMEPGRVGHLSMTEEFVESFKYSFPASRNIFSHISV